MNITRRQALTFSTAALLGTGTRITTALADGIGPNRGVVAKTWRGKQTCNNLSVPLSDVTNRISAPGDFIGSGCQMIEDSFEGPYFTCAPTPGKDISVGQVGQKLTVAMRLVDGDCKPIPGGVVDIWSCNATGHYSGYGYSPDESPPMVQAMLFGHIEPDHEQRFCRGALRTDAHGIAEFDTIYPGHYSGVPIHMHFKAHVDGKNLLTSQANFSEELNERIMKTAPYNAQRPISRNTDATEFQKMRIIERGGQLIAVLDLVVPA